MDLPRPGRDPSQGGTIPFVSDGISKSIVNEEELGSLDLIMGFTSSRCLSWRQLFGLWPFLQRGIGV